MGGLAAPPGLDRVDDVAGSPVLDPGRAAGLLRQAGLLPGGVRGAAYYPPLGRAARLLERVDPLLGRATRLGAAFIAIAGRKPAA